MARAEERSGVDAEPGLDAPAPREAAGRPREARRGKLKRRLAWALALPVVLVAAVTIADIAYSRRTAARYRAWNRTIKRDADGVREGCRAFTLEGGGERRETAVLMVHGFAAAPGLWRRMGAILAEKGHTCRAMRLPGFAMPMDDYRRTSLGRWREAVSSEVAGLRAAHGSVLIIGHSLGGALAIDHALDHPLDHPDAAAGVVLLAPLIAVSGERSPLLSPRGWYRVLGTVLHFTDVVETVTESECRDRTALDGIGAERHVPRCVHRGVFELIDRIDGRAEELGTPLFMALSRDDVTVDNEAASRYFEASPAEPKRLVHVEGSSHLLPVDRGYRGLAEEIARFVRTLEGDGD